MFVCVTSFSSYGERHVRGVVLFCDRVWCRFCRVCVVLFLSCVCVCDLFLFLQGAVCERSGSSCGRFWCCSCSVLCGVVFVLRFCV